MKGLGLVLSLILAAFAYYIYQQLEYVAEIKTQYSEAAQKNDFLALELLLEQQGVPLTQPEQYLSQHFFSQSQVNKHDLIILSNEFGDLSEDTVEALLLWVQQGGHLLATAHDAYFARSQGKTPLLLAKLGVRIEENTKLFSELNNAERENMHKSNGSKLLIEKQAIQISAQNDFVFVVEELISEQAQKDDKVAANKHENYLQLEYGQGRIAFLSNIDMWHNKNINQLENAWLAHYLTHDRSQVHLFKNLPIKTWFIYLVEHFPLLLLCIALTLLLFFWHALVRLGPTESLPQQQQQNFRLHLLAVGRFYWRFKQAATLLHHLREQLLKQASKRQANLLSLSQEQQVKALAKICSLPEEQVQLLLHQEVKTEQAFIQLIRNIKQVKEQL